MSGNDNKRPDDIHRLIFASICGGIIAQGGTYEAAVDMASRVADGAAEFYRDAFGLMPSTLVDVAPSQADPAVIALVKGAKLKEWVETKNVDAMQNFLNSLAGLGVELES